VLVNSPFIQIVTLLCLSALFILFLVFLSFHLRNVFLGEAPFVSTRKRVIPYIVEALNLSPGSVFYDLGCGDGRILAAAIADSYGITGIGIDLNPFACHIARIRNKRLPVKIYRGDIYKYSLREATHIYCYLLPNLLEKLETKIKNECNEGTVLVNCDFPFPTLTLKQEIELSNSVIGCKKIYVYKI
jgi:SAM-dependent methyltransferase